jgi:hypothetical protein
MGGGECRVWFENLFERKVQVPNLASPTPPPRHNTEDMSGSKCSLTGFLSSPGQNIFFLSLNIVAFFFSHSLCFCRLSAPFFFDKKSREKERKWLASAG